MYLPNSCKRNRSAKQSYSVDMPEETAVPLIIRTAGNTMRTVLQNVNSKQGIGPSPSHPLKFGIDT